MSRSNRLEAATSMLLSGIAVGPICGAAVGAAVGALWGLVGGNPAMAALGFVIGAIYGAFIGLNAGVALGVLTAISTFCSWRFAAGNYADLRLITFVNTIVTALVLLGGLIGGWLTSDLGAGVFFYLIPIVIAVLAVAVCSEKAVARIEPRS